MSSPCRASLLLLGLALGLAAPARAAEPFAVCAEPDNLPLSHRDEGGLEIEVAGILAWRMGRPLKVVWASQRDHSFLRVTIEAGACDAFMSIPAGFGRLATTRPWYRSGFMFLAPAGAGAAPAGLDDPRLRQWRIGVPVAWDGPGTPPAVALSRRALTANLRPFPIYDAGALARAVATGQVDLGVLWGPFAGWYAQEQEVPLRLTPLPAQDGAIPFAFDMAVGVRRGDAALRDALDQALAGSRPDIDAALAHWRVPVLR